MDLILWRHAEAHDGGPDLRRGLTPKGMKQAERVGAWLDTHLPDGCRILVSPADRAQQTAMALKRKFRTFDDLGPGATVAAVLRVAGWPDSRDAVLVVGHQPTLGEIVAFLMTGEESEWSIKKGGVCWLTNRVRQEETSVVLRAVHTPEFV
jgi:phosphohistidine phosphatase